jgi:hypothetical protein
VQAKDVASLHPFWIESPGHRPGLLVYRGLRVGEPEGAVVFETKKAATFGVPRPSKGIGHDGLDRKLPAKEERGVPDGHHVLSELQPRWGEQFAVF